VKKKLSVVGCTAVVSFLLVLYGQAAGPPRPQGHRCPRT
jgi:hypothetical protein